MELTCKCKRRTINQDPNQQVQRHLSEPGRDTSSSPPGASSTSSPAKGRGPDRVMRHCRAYPRPPPHRPCCGRQQPSPARAPIASAAMSPERNPRRPRRRPAQARWLCPTTPWHLRTLGKDQTGRWWRLRRQRTRPPTRRGTPSACPRRRRWAAGAAAVEASPSPVQRRR